MKLKDAIALAKEKEQLIGKYSIQGSKLDEVIIAPIEPAKYDEFIKTYLNHLNGKIALVPFQNDELCVVGVFDKHRILQENILTIHEL